jgi:ferredoxin-NADP reductase
MNRQWLTLKVAARRTEALDICSFELADPAGSNLPPLSAGAHVDVEVRDGLMWGRVPTSRVRLVGLDRS